MGSTPDEDFASHRLAELADRLERSLGPAAEVERNDSPFREVTVTPARNGALAVGWIEFGDEIILETLGGPGGRWELVRSDDHLAFLEDIVEAVIAGRVVEVKALGRSRVTVTLVDGRHATETGANAPSGCLPLPFWTRWGRTIRYSSYRG